MQGRLYANAGKGASIVGGPRRFRPRKGYVPAIPPGYREHAARLIGSVADFLDFPHFLRIFCEFSAIAASPPSDQSPQLEIPKALEDLAAGRASFR